MTTTHFILRTAIAALLGAAAVAGFANSASAQDLGAGETIAKTWCAGCHDVGLGGRKAGNDGVPSFSSIAQMSSTTATSLQVFLVTPHTKMPDYSLTRNEISNVSAYILSLRRK